MKENIKLPIGKVTIVVLEKGKEIKRHYSNLIVDGFKKSAARMMGHLTQNADSYFPTYLDVGTSDQAPSVNDTALIASAGVNRPFSTMAQVEFPNSPDETSILWKITLATEDANGLFLTEAGILDGAHRLLARVVHLPIEKYDAIEIRYEWEWLF